ncbi:MAG: flagellar filament capping protein FliD, partial [Tistlia sp.]
TQKKAEDAGPLFGTTVLSTVEGAMSRLLGAGATGVDPSYSVLAQIGVNFIDNDSLNDPLGNDTLVIDETKLDEALLNSPDAVKRLFAFDFSSSDPRVQLIGFDGKAAYDPAGYKINIGSVGSAAERSAAVVDETAPLQGVDSVAATTSGQFTLNGTAIAYDVAVDGLDDIVGRINLAGIPGISATLTAGDDGTYMQISATGSDPVEIAGDTGDLVAALGLTTQGTMIGSANVGGAAAGSDDGTATTSGRTITVTDQSGAEGLRMIYTGDAALSDVQIDFTVGLGASMFYELDRLLTANTGAVDAEIDTLTQQNTRNQERADFTLERLEFQREKMLERFVRMESLLATLNNQRKSLEQIVDAMSKRN